MKAIFLPISITKRRFSKRQFDELSKAAEGLLSPSGFKVTHESSNELTLEGPLRANPKHFLSCFTRLFLSKRGKQVQLIAQLRRDQSILALWRRYSFIGLLFLSNLLAMVLVSIGIPGSNPEVLPVIMIPISILGLIAAVQLRAQPSTITRAAGFDLDHFLHQIIDPNVKPERV